MKSIPRANIYFDRRYETIEKKHYISVRVTYCRKSKYYKTGISMTEAQFQKSYLAKSPQGIPYQMKKEIEEHLIKANAIISKLSPFSFQEFETKFFNTEYQVQGDLFKYFDKIILELLKNGQVSTSDVYKHTKNNLRLFLNKDSMPFDGITTDTLFKLDNWMKENEMKNASIGMYQRSLKAVYNRAIKSNLIGKQSNPFNKEGKLKPYIIPIASNKKKALKREDVNLIIGYNPVYGSARDRAKDFWLLSLYGNGLNMADLLTLKNKHYTGQDISFVRKKTIRTTKKEILIEIRVVDDMARIISKYRNIDRKPEALLFPFLTKFRDPVSIRKGIKNFTNSVNKQLKTLAKEIGITNGISTYFARYTFSNLAKNKNVSTEYISEALGHSNIRTTEIYLDSFNEEIRIENTNKIFEDLKYNT